MWGNIEHVPLKHAIPGSQDQPILSLCADTNATDNMLQFSLHLLGRLTFVGECIEVGLEGSALLLESIRGEDAGLRRGRIGDGDVVFVHAERCGECRGV